MQLQIGQTEIIQSISGADLLRNNIENIHE